MSPTNTIEQNYKPIFAFGMLGESAISHWHSNKCDLASDNVVCLVIDIVHDFMSPDGVFFAVYGAEESAPVHNVKDQIEQLLLQCQEKGISAIECSSEYTFKQFRTKGLENLCVSDEGRQSCLPSHFFKLRVTKNTNGLFDLVDKELLSELEKELADKYVLVVGVTTSSCIRQSVHALIERNFKVIVARDAVACRKSQTLNGEKTLNEWSLDSEERVFVFNSWRDVLSLL